jgi:hypothetical protein
MKLSAKQKQPHTQTTTGGKKRLLALVSISQNDLKPFNAEAMPSFPKAVGLTHSHPGCLKSQVEGPHRFYTPIQT